MFTKSTNLFGLLFSKVYLHIMTPLLISLYDRTGNWSRPYRENGWEVVQVDIQNGIDILTWDYRPYYQRGRKVIILSAQPCDDYATSGAKHFKRKDTDGTTERSQRLVAKTREIIEAFKPFAWALENPRTRIHKMNPWIGQRPVLIFNPCDYAGFAPEDVRESERYNKETWLFGKFNYPHTCRLEPLQKVYPGWSKLGGKSIETKNARSITPLGFAYAFYLAHR
jgi:hypothetical protein